MIIRGSIFSELVFIPDGDEFKQLLRTLRGRLVRTNSGYTFVSYLAIPYFTIKGQQYFGSVADSTVSFDNRQALLHNLQLTINLGDDQIIDASKGVVMPVGAKVAAGERGVSINHFPQLMALIPDGRVITGFNGTYDFNSKLFWGQVDFSNLDELWQRE